jgi:hypothetical protein
MQLWSSFEQILGKNTTFISKEEFVKVSRDSLRSNKASIEIAKGYINKFYNISMYDTPVILCMPRCVSHFSWMDGQHCFTLYVLLEKSGDDTTRGYMLFVNEIANHNKEHCLIGFSHDGIGLIYEARMYLNAPITEEEEEKDNDQ